VRFAVGRVGERLPGGRVGVRLAVGGVGVRSAVGRVEQGRFSVTLLRLNQSHGDQEDDQAGDAWGLEEVQEESWAHRDDLFLADLFLALRTFDQRQLEPLLHSPHGHEHRCLGRLHEFATFHGNPWCSWSKTPCTWKMLQTNEILNQETPKKMFRAPQHPYSVTFELGN
jgi:hypothetical protein